MLTIGLIREGKIPADNRVALTPHQCKWLQENKNIKIIAQSSPGRCFPDNEYLNAGIAVQEEMEECDILLGIKEVPVPDLIPNKTYLFFSHTKKLQPYNQLLFQAVIKKNITLIDYECLTHEDDSRILGFGYFAGVVGAHNGIMAYCNRHKLRPLPRVYEASDMNELVQFYANRSLPSVKIAVTGSGRVAKGIIEILNLMGIQEVTPAEYLNGKPDRAVFVQLKGADLYLPKNGENYHREDFHENPEKYKCLFPHYLGETQILMNGIYWDENIPRLFQMEDMQSPEFAIETIADVTDDQFGSVPCNMGDATIENPVYGVDKFTGKVTAPYLPDSVDVMAVGNLPNELPKEASKYFGEQLIKYVIDDLIHNGSAIIDRATIVKKGCITTAYEYMKQYAEV